MSRRRRSGPASPLDMLIGDFGLAMQRTGWSRRASSGVTTSQFDSPNLLAHFQADSSDERIMMSFTERTRHARLLTIEERPGKTFMLLFSDPDYTILLVQDAEGRNWFRCLQFTRRCCRFKHIVRRAAKRRTRQAAIAGAALGCDWHHAAVATHRSFQETFWRSC